MWSQKCWMEENNLFSLVAGYNLSIQLSMGWPSLPQGHTVNLCSACLWGSQTSRTFSAKLLSIHSVTSLKCWMGLLHHRCRMPQVPLLKLHEVPASPFLLHVQVPVHSSLPAYAQFPPWKLAESALHPIIHTINEKGPLIVYATLISLKEYRFLWCFLRSKSLMIWTNVLSRKSVKEQSLKQVWCLSSSPK